MMDMTLDLADTSSAADWVTQSRIKESINKSKALRQAQLQQKKLEEEEEEMLQQAKAYTSADLKGMHIKHGGADFEMGKEVILTLADTDILEVDEHGKLLGLNEESDVLENVNISDKDRKLEREKRLKRNRQPIYSALDDHEFKEGVEPGTKASILSQYDKEEKVRSQLILGDNGMIDQGTLAPMDADAPTRYSQLTLNSGVKFASEFFTPKEYATFKAKSGGKKKRSTRKSTADDGDDGEPPSSVAATYGSSSSTGTTTTVPAVKEEEEETFQNPLEPKPMEVINESVVAGAMENALAEEELKKKENYERAVHRASQISRLNPNYNPEVAEAVGTKGAAAVAQLPVEYSKANYLQAKAAHQKYLNSSVNRINPKVILDLEDDDDRELRESLAKARRIALATRKPDEDQEENGNNGSSSSSSTSGAIVGKVDDRGAKNVLALTQSFQSKEEVVMKTERDSEEQEGDEDIDADGRRADGTLVFNSTTEFTSRLQARLNEKARLQTENAMKELERSSSSVMASSSSVAAHSTSSASTVPLNAAAAATSNKRKFEGESSSSSGGGGGMQISSGGANAEAMEEEEDDIYNERGLNNNNDSDGDSDEDDDDLDDEQLAFLNQPTVSKGMAGTLALLKSTGELKKTETLTGRAKDTRSNDPSAGDFDVKIEYRDEKGRKLTQKEAFRQLSYRFHGYGPGQKKKAKRMKAMDIQNKATTSKTGILEGSGGVMGSFTKTQEATGKAHLTIQGGASNAAVAGLNLAAFAKKK